MSGVMETRSKLVEDDTTIYEVDLDCFDCLSEEERQQYYGSQKAGEGVAE